MYLPIGIKIGKSMLPPTWMDSGKVVVGGKVGGMEGWGPVGGCVLGVVLGC